VSGRCRGFSLTELLVATALLAIATGGGITALARAHVVWREANLQQQLHERAQYVFATLEPDLQMAGYFGGSGSPGALAVTAIPTPALRCGPELIRRLDVALEVAPNWPLSCAANAGGAVTGSDVLTIRRASARLASAAEPGRAQWLGNSVQPQRSRLTWVGDTAWRPIDVAVGEELREVLVRVYYVAREADGETTLPALRMKALTSIAGVPAFMDTEVMHGIEQLRIEVLPTAAEPRSVRVHLRVRATAPGAGANAATGTLQVERRFTLRNAPE
jgi:prepilin-type N-terminal cleavage/methylation domain-containing protein